MLDLKALLNKILTQWGGYLTSKFYEIFLHLERWWEHVRCEGFVGENIKRSIQSCRRDRLLSTCKLQRDDTHGWFNNLYQITKRSLCGFLFSRCKNDASTNGVACNKDSGEQSYIGVHKPILLYIKRWWHIQILLRKQSSGLAQCCGYLERKYRLSSWRRGNNVRYGKYNITQISNGGGMSHVGFESTFSEDIERFPRVNYSKNLHRFWESLQHILRNNCNRRNANRIYANSNSKSFAKPSSVALLFMAIKRKYCNNWCIKRHVKRNNIVIIDYNRCGLYQDGIGGITLERGCLAC